MSTSRSRRLLIGACVVAAVFFAELLALPDLVASRSKNTIDSWISAHASALPDTLEEISAYPIEYRRKIAARLPLKTRTGLWRAQLEAYLEAHPEMSAAKKDVFVKSIRALAAEPYVRTGDGPSGQLAAICKNQTPGLTTEEKQAFATLGSPTPTYSSFEAKRLWLVQAIRDRLVVDAQPLGGECSCSQDSWCSCWDCTGGCITPGTYDCGCFWMYYCDGRCP